MRSSLPFAVLAFLTSACVSTPDRPTHSSRTAVETPNTAFRAPTVMRGATVNRVIGQPASRLADRFGKPRIDLVESDARKLQFISDSCVLDIYLYPLEVGSAPVATHIEVRNRQTGNAVAPAECIASIESRP